VPTAAPTSTPTSIAFVCPVPTNGAGTYTSIYSSGTVVGNTYTDSGSGYWEVDNFIAPTPGPSPSASLAPTPTPTATATEPGASPTPEALCGTYTVPSFSGTGLTPGYTAATTTGSFTLYVGYPEGVGTALLRRARAASVNAYGNGYANPFTISRTYADFGPITSLTITNLTAHSGTGAFTFGQSNQGGRGGINVKGTVTILGPGIGIAPPCATRTFRLGEGRGPQC
jgi:hypothetical protein